MIYFIDKELIINNLINDEDVNLKPVLLDPQSYIDFLS